MRDALRRRDALIGLAPAPSIACPRCGTPTTALANGRGRLDLCPRCGTVEFATPEGLELFRFHEERFRSPGGEWKKEGAARPPREERAGAP